MGTMSRGWGGDEVVSSSPCQSLVLSTQYSVLRAQCSELRAQSSVLRAQCSKLKAQSSDLSAQSSVLSAQSSELSAQCWQFTHYLHYQQQTEELGAGLTVDMSCPMVERTESMYQNKS